MKRLYIETYGCQMNVADTELMLGVLGREGYVQTDEPAEADVLLVNTCAVRDNAEQRVIGRLGELQQYKRSGGVLGVVGCMAQRLGPQLLERVPKVDIVAGPDGYRNLASLIGQAAGGTRGSDTEFRSWEHYEDVPPVRENGATAFVTVQRGCDYKCTFCIVPFTRGPERSRKLEDVVREVRTLAEQGTTEVTLLGQTVNSYHDGSHDFADLLAAVGGVDGIRRVRFTSPYPTDFTERVIAAMAEVPAVCEHVHLPAQSGSNAVLRRMLRRYTREEYLAVVGRLRAAMPGITFSTDLIVGFPGETEAQFQETLSLVEAAGFDDAYTFKYSVRDGTPAVRLKDHVPDAEAGGAVGAAHRAGPQSGAPETPGPRGSDPRGAGGAARAPRRPHAGALPHQPHGPARAAGFGHRRIPPGAAYRYDRVHLHGAAGPAPARGARMNKPAIRNAIEDHVVEAYDQLVVHFKDFCGCDTCRLDVLVFALNRLPPRYVIGREGAVVTDLNLDKDQSRAAIEVTVMEGIRKVNLAPRCGRKSGGVRQP
ncbi:MAG: tRNA (N6-isopentenyl adenosine(37)-C2)-methylthiotransferase MiaB [Gemmatimonadota bacterium]|nr:tRNA (N6-isopentenyl adenosine(37)-C2)-methylthiotransferase MiaB [Gemmatimonadota bacterium]